MSPPRTPPPSRRLRLSTAETMGLIALIAVALAEPGLMPTACLVAGLRLAVALGSPRAFGRLVPLAVVLAAVYGPMFLGFVLTAPGTSRRREWSANATIAPGSPPALLARRSVLAHLGHDLADALFFAIAAAATTSLVLVLLLLAGRSPRRIAVTAAIGLAVSLVSSKVLLDAL